MANKCGVHRSTIWQWKKKWDEVNKNVQLNIPNRPTRAHSSHADSLGYKLGANKKSLQKNLDSSNGEPQGIYLETDSA